MIKRLFYGIVLLSLVSHGYAAIPITQVNTTTPGLYEKFEVVYDLNGFSYTNPYNPEEIDVTVVFTAPSGKTWSVFGFFDDYKEAGEWKVRFSPNEIGEWQYQIQATDVNGADQSTVQTFTAVESDHHGWILVSEENPHYLRHDDGAGWFGVGMYTPWRNDVAKYDQLTQYGGNTFAIWNIMYGGLTNGHGIIEEELGRYNQTKCGKIDTLLMIAEDRDLKCMYCFWPHDLFSKTVWAAQWNENPYNTICDVVDVYSDSLCWEYQKRQYRYLIARFAHSRSLAFWEMMNEINGTDGYQAGRYDEVLEWVRKVDAYFKENDPYGHPTTASRSGGFIEYWPEMYVHMDLPNLHVYETQGWPTVYSGNVLRSSLYNYAWAAQRFWKVFDKPGIFGEAGADWVSFDTHSPEYLAHYHNAIWACLTNGGATTPYWWTFTNPIRDLEREQMAHLSKFVEDIDFIRQSREHFESINDLYDLYGMDNDSTAFGWIREVNGVDIRGMQFDLEGVLHADIPVYAIRYYDPWTGQDLDTRIRPHVGHRFRDRIPDFDRQIPDVAFTLLPAQGGNTPSWLELTADGYEVMNIDTQQVAVTCYLFDDSGRFCPQAEALVQFHVDGPGGFAGSGETEASNGMAVIEYQVPNELGIAKIIATSPGLQSDTLTIRIKDRMVLDDFESYQSDDFLKKAWLTRSSTKADPFLDTELSQNDGKNMRLEYGIGSDYRSTAIVETKITRSFEGAKALTFRMKPDGSNRELEIRLMESIRYFWVGTVLLDGTEAETIILPFDELQAKDDSVPLDPSKLTALRLIIRKESGTDGTGTLWFDDFRFSEAATGIQDQKDDPVTPYQFRLGQNYPNPFNASTKIEYSLSEDNHVNLSIFNTSGQRLVTLIDGVQEAGNHSIHWDVPVGHASGVYFYRLVAGDMTRIKKGILIK